MLHEVSLAELPEGGLQGLTGKQLRFCLLVFQGLSQSEAYRRAYDCAGSSPETIGTRASELAASSKVKAKLADLRLKAEAQATLAPTLSKDWIINGIMGLAVHADKDSTKLQAYVHLGKMAGIDLFRDIVVRETKPRTVEDVEQELRARLKQLGNELGDNAKDITPAAIANPSDRRRKPRT